ncbi:hypothetical protein [Nonomuraea sp. NPDC005650]|uniref:hypothetical protein n=1 Tax=Nonomuraea sp. NPDC005650 TaxID=3157045 RepID=UPI0033A741C1
MRAGPVKGTRPSPRPRDALRTSPRTCAVLLSAPRAPAHRPGYALTANGICLLASARIRLLASRRR